MNVVDEEGNPTGHLAGVFQRTAQLMEFGIRPVWVFDGTAPDVKAKVKEMRRGKTEDTAEGAEGGPKRVAITAFHRERKPGAEQQKKLKSGNEIQTQEMEQQFLARIAKLTEEPIPISNCQDYLCLGESDNDPTAEAPDVQAKIEPDKGRIADAVELYNENAEEVQSMKSLKDINITIDMINDCKYMLSIMGVPYIDSPCEAEAQCAELVRQGKAYAVASEDMDSLAFKAPILLRNIRHPREPVVEISFEEVLRSLQMTHETFVDLCILCGCDYCPNIEGVGFHTAFRLIAQLGSIEKILEFVAQQKGSRFRVPEFYPFDEARSIFLKPSVDENVTLKWETMDNTAIYDFLVRDKKVSVKRVEIGLEKIAKYRHKPAQVSIDSFFKFGTAKRERQIVPDPPEDKKKKRAKKSAVQNT